MSWFITNLIATFILPPLSLLLPLGLAILLFYRRPKVARAIFIASFVLLWILFTPYFAESALHLLEARTTPLDIKCQDADAIVILGGGTYFHAPEYDGQDTVGEPTLLRLRYGAKLHRETGKPILVTGGKPLGNELSEAQQMRTSLEQDFHAKVRWTEDESDNTYENALRSFSLLQKEGMKRIYLVTHAWHMPRSAAIFRRAGFEVVEAPIAFTTRYQTDLLTFLPQAGSLQGSKMFIHELIGMFWYRIKSAISNN